MPSEATTSSLAEAQETPQVIDVDSNMSGSDSPEQVCDSAESSSATLFSTSRPFPTTPRLSKRLKNQRFATSMTHDTLFIAPKPPQKLTLLSTPGHKELPEEIWRQISQLLDTPDLLSFRQVCKLFAKLGLDRMMETISIIETTWSFKRLYDKLRNPSALDSIQRNTKTFKIFTIQDMLPPIRGLSLDEEKILEDCDNIKVKLVDRRFLGDAIQFPILEKLVIKGACFLLEEKMVLSPSISNEVALCYSLGLDVLYEGMRRDMDGRALACAARGLHKHNLTPRILQAETSCAYLCEDEVMRDVQYLFRHLEEISLYINIVDLTSPWEVEPDFHSNPQRYWARCFEIAECVKDIRIAFAWGVFEEWESISLEYWLGRTQWHYLHTLKLVDLKCDSDLILSVIHRNGSSLRNLSFKSLAVERGQLELFFRGLREYTAAGDIKLETLELKEIIWEVQDFDVGAGELHYYYLVDALPDLSNPDTQRYKKEGHWPDAWPEVGKELRDAVKDYVLCGGPEIWGLYTSPALFDDIYKVREELLDVEDLG